MSLARRFKRRDQVIAGFRRVATIEKGANFRRRYATRTLLPLPRPFKGRAKLMPTLRVEDT